MQLSKESLQQFGCPVGQVGFALTFSAERRQEYLEEEEVCGEGPRAWGPMSGLLRCCDVIMWSHDPLYSPLLRRYSGSSGLQPDSAGLVRPD